MKILNVSLLMAFIVLSCSDEPATFTKKEAPPHIESVRISDRWNLADTSGLNLVEVRVSDPQGFYDIKWVLLKVPTTSGVRTDSLYDDGGLNGSTDVLAGDGVFRNLFSAAHFTNVDETLDFKLVVSDNSDFRDSVTVPVIFAFNTPPLLNRISAPDSLNGDGAIHIVTAHVNDIDARLQDLSVTLDLMRDNISILAEAYLLSNAGDFAVSGDLIANDTVFSFKMDSTFAAGRKGNYRLNFVAIDQFRDSSATLSSAIFIENLAGEIISINLPESVVRPANIPISARVRDPQGITDIQRVFFELKDSAGNYIESFPGVRLQLTLFDDGDLDTHGDAIMDDSIFSIILAVTEQNIAETYTFEFYAVDKVGNVSLQKSAILEIL